MRRPPGQAARLLAALGAALAGCAHAPSAPPRVEVVYPGPPAAPLARHVASIPGAAFEAPRPSALQRLAGAVAGLGPDETATLFDRPFGLAVTSDGALVVTDPDRPRVLRLDLARHALVALECRGHAWESPAAAAGAPGGVLFVADAGAGLVARLDPAGGCALLGRGQLTRPTGVAVRAERVYVADPPSHAVVILSTDGAVLGRLDDLGPELGSLHFPSAVAVDGPRLLVVDALNVRVVRFDAADRPVDALGGPEEVQGGLARPKAVAVDGRGRTLVSDAERGRVVVFDQDGRPLFTVGAPGDGDADLSLPAGMALIGAFLYVADSAHRRIQVYELLGEPS